MSGVGALLIRWPLGSRGVCCGFADVRCLRALANPAGEAAGAAELFVEIAQRLLIAFDRRFGGAERDFVRQRLLDSLRVGFSGKFVDRIAVQHESAHRTDAQRHTPETVGETTRATR